ncbi:hypothetical protein L9F63_007058, partial [Diploptera punctata]
FEYVYYISRYSPFKLQFFIMTLYFIFSLKFFLSQLHIFEFLISCFLCLLLLNYLYCLYFIV